MRKTTGKQTAGVTVDGGAPSNGDGCVKARANGGRGFQHEVADKAGLGRVAGYDSDSHLRERQRDEQRDEQQRAHVVGVLRTEIRELPPRREEKTRRPAHVMRGAVGELRLRSAIVSGASHGKHTTAYCTARHVGLFAKVQRTWVATGTMHTMATRQSCTSAAQQYMQTTHQRQPARGVESRFANVGRAAVVMQDPDTTRDAERVVARLVALIKSLSFVTEEAVRPETVGLCERGLSVSFLCEPAAGWDRLPASWRDYLECDAARAHVAIQQRLACDDDAPDSLRAALSSVRECLATIPYAASHDTHPHTAIDPRLLRGMKGKKRAECAALAPLIAATARRCGATTVVDVGCGHGHLARVLAAHYALRVIGIDASDYHAGEARRKTDNVDAQLFAGSGVQFVQRRITAHTSAADVAELLRECATADCDAAGKQNTAARPRVLLVGLHTCGDLAPVMARLVCDAPHLFAGLVNVPCCYQKNYCGTVSFACLRDRSI